MQENEYIVEDDSKSIYMESFENKLKNDEPTKRKNTKLEELKIKARKHKS